MKKLFSVVLSIFTGIIIGGISIFIIMKNHSKFSKKGNTKFKSYYEVANNWLILKNENKKIEDYFINNGHKDIAIYGMGHLGNRLFEELSKSDKLDIKYAIDKDSFNAHPSLKIITLDDDLDEVDIIVITVVFDYYDIKTTLSKKTNCLIVSLKDVIEGV